MKRRTRIDLNNLYELTGIFSTFTALQLFGVSIFYLLLLVCVVCGLMKGRGKISKGVDKSILLLGLIALLSCLISLLNEDMPLYWIKDNLKKTIVFIMLFCGISLFNDEKEKVLFKSNYIRGLYVSVLCQMCWGILQFLLWYMAKISLNDVVFNKILGVNLLNSTWVNIYNTGTIRLTGISWEPAYFSMAMVTGFLLSKKIALKLAFAGTCLLSTSRTGLVLLVIALILESGSSWSDFRIKKKKLISLFRFLAIGFLCTIAILIFSNRIRSIVEEAFLSLINWNKTTSGGTHFNYLRYMLNIFDQQSFVNKLFGYGIASSGFPYMKYHYEEFGKYTTSWCPESDIINMLFGLGILGLFTYYFMLSEAIIKEKNKDIRNMLICFAIGGVLYIYYGSWVFVSIIVCTNSSTVIQNVLKNYSWRSSAKKSLKRKYIS